MSSEAEPLVANASDVRQVRAAGKKANQRDRMLMDQLNAILGTRMGRKWYWNKMNQWNVFSTTFNENAYTMAFNEGARSAGLALLMEVNLIAPDVLIAMRQEANEDAERGL